MHNRPNYFIDLFNSQKFLANVPVPVDPPIEPGEGDAPPTFISNQIGHVVPRYTCNVAVVEQLPVLDFLHEVLFISSRHYLSQGPDGKIRLRTKKPVDGAHGLGLFDIGDTTIAVDDIRAWLTDTRGHLLIDPHTTNSEIRDVVSANYDTAANSVTLATTGTTASLTIAGFAGCDGAATPATATITVDSNENPDTTSFELDGTEIAYNAGTGDDPISLAAFITATINRHPAVSHRFFATTDGIDTVTITATFGDIVVNAPLVRQHAAPIADPATEPTIAAAASGALAAGDYYVFYSWVTERGQTLLSPGSVVTLAADENITVTGVTPPAGVGSVNWYVSPGPGSNFLRLHSNNDGSGFTIDSLPLLTATLPPELNNTGTEIMRIQGAFSDRGETRTNLTRSNVLRATYEWLLRDREKSYNRVDFAYRNQLKDYQLTTLRISDRVNIAKVKKTTPFEVNGQAINNTFQAIRNASSLLAEKRDCDFFYKWGSTREALLFEEGDVVAITDAGCGVINFPVMIQEISFDASSSGLPKVSFSGQKFSNYLYDDSINERIVPTVIEPANPFTFPAIEPPVVVTADTLVFSGDSVVFSGDGLTFTG